MEQGLLLFAGEMLGRDDSEVLECSRSLRTLSPTSSQLVSSQTDFGHFKSLLGQ